MGRVYFVCWISIWPWGAAHGRANKTWARDSPGSLATYSHNSDSNPLHARTRTRTHLQAQTWISQQLSGWQNEHFIFDFWGWVYRCCVSVLPGCETQWDEVRCWFNVDEGQVVNVSCSDIFQHFSAGQGQWVQLSGLVGDVFIIQLHFPFCCGWAVERESDRIRILVPFHNLQKFSSLSLFCILVADNTQYRFNPILSPSKTKYWELKLKKKLL